MSSFKMCDNSFEISSWYRPINLMKCLGLGFVYPGYNEIKEFTKNIMLYKCKTPKGYSVKKVKDVERAYNFYISLIENKKFAFCPDLDFFKNWINQFPTYLVKYNKIDVGIFSITSIHCKTSIEGKLCLPVTFNCIENNNKVNVLKCLLSVAEEKGYDALYTHSVGDLDEITLKNVNSVKTKENSWFSIYNNNIDLTVKDLYIPLL